VSVAAPLNRQEILRSIRAATATGRKNILIVDDEVSFREVVKLVLTGEGYSVAEAGDGREALEKLSASKPDLLLLDLNIPEISGWEIIRRISLDPNLKDVEVLVVSGAVLDEQETSTLHARTSGFINKADFRVDTVLERVANLLEVQ
jgi:CheY-like chemotaxis protein